MDAEDAELLRRYVRDRAEEAFAELVRRYLTLVYHAALRQIGGDAATAEDVTQQVFTLLARKASSLTRHQTLAGWLHTTTRFAASEARRTERRRCAREQEAHLMHELSATESTADWEQLRPVIDEALGELNERDREAVLLRFFAGLPLAQVGVKLNLAENTARMRVERALDKLHTLLARRGITSTTAALGVALTNQATAAMPAGLAASVASVAVAGVTTTGVGAAVGVFSFMSTSQFTATVAVLAAIAAIGTAVHNVREAHAAEAALAKATQASAAASAQLHELERRAGQISKPVPVTSGSANSNRFVLIPPSADMLAMLKRGEEFLAAHPEFRSVLEARRLQVFEQNYGPKLRALGYSGADYERIVATLASESSIGIGRFRLNPDQKTPFDAGGGRLQEGLGRENFRRYHELVVKEKLEAVVRELAGTASLAGIPLLPAQTQKLATIIESQSPEKEFWPDSVVLKPNWKTIEQQAAAILSPPQLSLFHTAIESDGPLSVSKPVPFP